MTPEFVAFFSTFELFHPVHLVIEGVFLVIILMILRQPVRKAGRNPDTARPTMEETAQMVAEFTSKPFCMEAQVMYAPKQLSHNAPLSLSTISEVDGCHVVVDGKKCVNMASFDYHSLSKSTGVRDKALEIMKHYGVGSCGPRGFYGSFDTHLQLELDLAAFMKQEGCITYSFQSATTPTAIPCFSSRGDWILCDSGVNLNIQKGVSLSRSNVMFFRHNDIDDLTEKMRQVDKKIKGKKQNTVRKFVVAEGLYLNHGDFCPLPAIVKLKKQFRYRLILDDSYGFGAVGHTGRGTPEHFSVPQRDVDIYLGALCTSLGSVGGFCVGSTHVVDHQVLSAVGYVFSASLPPLITGSASTALKELQEHPEWIADLSVKSDLLRNELRKQLAVHRYTVVGDSGSPITHIIPQINMLLPAQFTGGPHSRTQSMESVGSELESRDSDPGSRSPTPTIGTPVVQTVPAVTFLDKLSDKAVKEANDRLDQAVSTLRNFGVAVVRPEYTFEHCDPRPQPSIRLTMKTAVPEADIKEKARIIAREIQGVF